MSSFWSRILVVVALLPLTLGVVWLGGWWMLAFGTVAALLALHEFYSIARALRPLVLAGFVGTIAALLGAQLGGGVWMLGGFMTTLAFAFCLNTIAETRAPATVAVGTTVFGVAWVTLGLGFLVLVRALSDHGRLAIFAVLLTVFAADTVAYGAGRLFGRHKLAPTMSPGKTWEGFVVGSAAGVFVMFITLYKQHFVDGWRAIVLGLVVVLAGAAGDLFESALKRDMQVKDSGRLLAGHGGMLDRIDALLFAAPAAYFVLLAYGYT
jgi:phosphatidate cytidylyltransferase